MEGGVDSPAGPSRELQPWRKTLLYVVPAQFVANIGFGLATPFMPLFIGELGEFTPREIALWAGVASSLASLVSIVAGPIWGILSDWYGHKRNVLRASFGAGIVMALTSLVRNVPEAMGRSVVMGGVAGVFPATLGLVGAVVPKRHLVYAIGLVQATSSLGGTLGPLMGGLVAAWFSFRVAFVVAGGLLIVSGLLFLVKVREDFHPTPSSRHNLRTFLADVRALMTAPNVARTLGLLSLVQLAPSIVSPILPLLVVSLNPTQGVVSTGVLFTMMGLSTVVGSYGAGLAASWLGERRLFLLSAVLAGVSAYLMAASGSLVVVIALSAGLGLGVGILSTVASAVVGKLAPGDREGAAFGLVQSANGLGSAVGPLLGGGMAAFLGLRSTFWLEGSVFLLMAFVVYATKRL